MRVLGLDVGQQRIGVALSDPTGMLASPLTTIVSARDSERLDSVLSLAAEHGVAEIVVGLPLALSGRRGPQARLVARFAEQLAARSSVPVKTVDERYSSVEAARLLRQAGLKPSMDRGRVDGAAAALILQSHLDSRRAARDRGFLQQGAGPRFPSSC